MFQLFKMFSWHFISVNIQNIINYIVNQQNDALMIIYKI